MDGSGRVQQDQIMKMADEPTEFLIAEESRHAGSESNTDRHESLTARMFRHRLERRPPACALYRYLHQPLPIDQQCSVRSTVSSGS